MIIGASNSLCGKILLACKGSLLGKQCGALQSMRLVNTAAACLSACLFA
jgi:hypothetical protein